MVHVLPEVCLNMFSENVIQCGESEAESRGDRESKNTNMLLPRLVSTDNEVPQRARKEVDSAEEVGPNIDRLIVKTADGGNGIKVGICPRSSNHACCSWMRHGKSGCLAAVDQLREHHFVSKI